MKTIKDKILKNPKEISEIVSNLKSKGEKIIFTNGCFDILHIGHINTLFEAKELGGFLFVGLNSDFSIKQIKGRSRPIINENDRAIIIASLFFVDFVILFPEKTPINLIKDVCPNYLVKGGNYLIEQVVGGEFVKSYGGVVSVIELVEGKSTTKILNLLSAQE